MSLVVKLEDDLGERSDWVILNGVIPSRDEREFPFLRTIDPYGRTVFQNLQYSDTPMQPLISMHYTDTTAPPGRKHRYHVIAVNTVGLKSK